MSSQKGMERQSQRDLKLLLIHHKQYGRNDVWSTIYEVPYATLRLYRASSVPCIDNQEKYYEVKSKNNTSFVLSNSDLAKLINLKILEVNGLKTFSDNRVVESELEYPEYGQKTFGPGYACNYIDNKEVSKLDFLFFKKDEYLNQCEQEFSEVEVQEEFFDTSDTPTEEISALQKNNNQH